MTDSPARNLQNSLAAFLAKKAEFDALLDEWVQPPLPVAPRPYLQAYSVGQGEGLPWWALGGAALLINLAAIILHWAGVV